MMMNPIVKTFSGHRDAQVNCIVPAAVTTAPLFNFASCDSKGFVATWDVRSPRRMAAVALPFLSIGRANVDIMEIVTMNDNNNTLALSDDRLAVIDWRNPKVPLWSLGTRDIAMASSLSLSGKTTTTTTTTAAAAAADKSSPSSSSESNASDDNDDVTFSTALWMPSFAASPSPGSSHHNKNGGDDNEKVSKKFSSSSSSSLWVFSSNGRISVLDGSNGNLVRSSPPEFQLREEAQLPCGVSRLPSSRTSSSIPPPSSCSTSLSSSALSVPERCCILASTLGEVSLVDAQSWSILGSAKLGGIIDADDDDEEEGERGNDNNNDKLANPPLLASLDCKFTEFASSGGRGGDDDDDGDENKPSSVSSVNSPTTTAAAATALVARADGVVAFAHIQPNSYPAVERLADITVLDLNAQLCAAKWMNINNSSSSSSSAPPLIACVGTCGQISLWQIPSAALLPCCCATDENENDGGDQENEDDEDSPACLAQCNLRSSKFGFNDAQREGAFDAEVNCCACLPQPSSSSSSFGAVLPSLLVGDSVGRIMSVEFGE